MSIEREGSTPAARAEVILDEAYRWAPGEVIVAATNPHIGDPSGFRRLRLGEWTPAGFVSDHASAMFDGFPLEGMVGIDFDEAIPEHDWWESPACIRPAQREWFALLQRTVGGFVRNERVQIPQPVIAELRHSHPDGVIPGTRLQAEINAAAERVAQGYLDIPQRYVAGTDLPTHPYDAGTPLSGDRSSPDTSQPYFLDLIRRIDDVTEDRP